MYKTRTLAATACREGKITVLGDVVKPAREVKEGEEITVRKGAIHFKWKVVALPASRVGPPLVADYAEDITPQEELTKLQMIKDGHNQRPRGLGRPTKRDRRDIDRFFR